MKKIAFSVLLPADFSDAVKKSAKQKVLFTRHALDQMNKPERLISEEEVKAVVMKGDIIEEYPEDPRGESCLMLGYAEERQPVHVVCSPKDTYLAVITAYRPDPEEWDLGFKVRRRR